MKLFNAIIHPINVLGNGQLQQTPKIDALVNSPRAWNGLYTNRGMEKCQILGLVSGSEFPQWKAGVPMLKLAIPK